jgi:ribosomal protein S18 acetylase RimI-like enzyme
VPDPLENPVHSALTGPQRAVAEVRGAAARYLPTVAPFAALPLDPTAQDWADLAALVGPGGQVVLAGPERPAPASTVDPAGSVSASTVDSAGSVSASTVDSAGSVSASTVDPARSVVTWEQTMDLPGVQMDGTAFAAEPDPEAVVLTPADVPEMLDLVARTRPGPFKTDTIALGTYLGIRREGALVAMAGERMRVPGHTEISAVCTDESVRGQGLATRLMRAVAVVVRERGDEPFLHAAAGNTGAIRLYEHLGFTVSRKVRFAAYRLA